MGSWDPETCSKVSTRSCQAEWRGSSYFPLPTWAKLNGVVRDWPYLTGPMAPLCWEHNNLLLSQNFWTDPTSGIKGNYGPPPLWPMPLPTPPDEKSWSNSGLIVGKADAISSSWRWVRKALHFSASPEKCSAMARSENTGRPLRPVEGEETLEEAVVTDVGADGNALFPGRLTSTCIRNLRWWIWATVCLKLLLLISQVSHSSVHCCQLIFILQNTLLLGTDSSRKDV